MPALLVAAGMLSFFDPKAFHFAVYGVDTLTVVVAVATTLSLVPFFVLLASVMRVATITKHTLSIGPFILRETEGVAEVEWDR
ncbi:MAG: hypothetical protein ABEJ59_04385 [Halanaeroarchaeum sp.]